jgi:hypothetical protein
VARDDFLSKDGNGVLRRVRSLVLGTEPVSGENVHAPLQFVATGPYRVLGKEQLVVTTGAVVALGAVLGSIPAGALSAVCAVDPDGAVRYQEDNSNPATGAAGAGMYVAGGGAFEVAPLSATDGTLLAQVKLIAVSTTVRVNVTYRGPF